MKRRTLGIVTAAAAALILGLANLPGHGTGKAPTSALPADQTQTATFAGGCFWCMEPPFDKLDGVISTTSGYTGGNTKNPNYREVSAGKTGHAEVVQIVFDPTQVTFETLLNVFWMNIDPTAKDRQFCDTGNQYRSEIFYHNGDQKRAAEQSLAELQKSKPFKDPIVTGISRVGAFYPAESYHQDYYQKNPMRYRFYRFNCGRDQRLRALWGEKET